MFEGYILVGGRSSRMKSNKANLRLGGKTFAERAVDPLRKITENCIYFVSAANQTDNSFENLPTEIPTIIDVFPDKAAIGGIYTALKNSKNEWAAILACDYPLVTEDLLVRLASIAESVKPDVSAVVPVQIDGRVQPLCALYRVEPCLIAAEQLLKDERIPPARNLMENVKTRLAPFAEWSDLEASENFFINVNTPEDFNKVQSIYQKTQNNEPNDGI